MSAMTRPGGAEAVLAVVARAWCGSARRSRSSRRTGARFAPVTSSKRAARSYGHGLAAREHAPQRREVERLDERRPQHHQELRAHAREHGDPLALDGAERLVGVETRLAPRWSHRAPSGVTCDVHSPNPNGAGSAPKNTSSAGHRAGRSRELVEVHPPVLVVHHDTSAYRSCPTWSSGGRDRRRRTRGRRVPRRERRCLGRRPRRRRLTTTCCARGSPSARSASTMASAGSPRCSCEVTMPDAPVVAEDVAQLAVAGAVAEADDGETGALGGDEGDVHRDPVGEQHRDAAPAGSPVRTSAVRQRGARARRTPTSWRAGRRRRWRARPACSRAHCATASPTVVSPHHPARL